MNYTKEQQLGKRTKKKSKNFTEKTKRDIFERDNWQCVKCGSHLIESVPHHIIYKSAGGTGEKRNGVTVCRNCHDWAHHKKDSKFGEPSREGRKWFEKWRDENLDENGDRI
ncbi:HNH endonuclease [Ornithinibacillus xuwenensis]|uniref:HNH endonuclease n=1 Tax=Ornithinibacillus xuwenensis TaxID=3144668 RepID=A0ABU9XFW0_9BACI